MGNVAENVALSGISERELAEALSDHCQLSMETKQQIVAAMQESGSTFIEAALALKLITEADIEDALAWHTKRSSKTRTSFVETAINKISRVRSPVVIEGTQVTPGPQLLLAHDPDHPRSEQLRALRTELLLLDGAAGQSRTLATISPSSGEGRSQLAAELSIAFSQLGRRTLLIDADLRKPKQHVLFNSENLYGLSQALITGEPAILNSVKDLPYLALLTSGPLPSNPLELLSDGRLARLVTNVANTFDFIILDTPPISKFADGLAVATIAGRVLLTGRAMHTTYKDTRNLLRRLGTTRAQVMGAVINHF